MSRKGNKKKETPESLALGQKLVEAAQNLNLEEIKSLIIKGANIDYVERTNSNDWYSGDSHTPLSAACEAKFTDQNLYIDTIQHLLQNGADLNFKMLRGNWNRSSQYSVIRQIPLKLKKFKKQQNIVKLITILSKYGLNVNKVDMIHTEYRNGYSQYNFTQAKKYNLLCQLISAKKIQVLIAQNLGSIITQQPEQEDQRPLPQNNIQNQLRGSQINKQPNFAFIEKLLYLGVDPNSLNSQNTLSGGGFYGRGEYYRKSQEYSIFHRVIMSNSLILVKKCLQKGADVDKLCSITIGKPIYPFQWSEDDKQQKKEQNKNSIQQSENKKTEMQKKLKEYLRTQNSQQARECKVRLRELEFEIFKAKRFSIENQEPTTKFITKKLNCLQIAEALNVSSQIIKLLEEYQQSSSPNKRNDANCLEYPNI